VTADEGRRLEVLEHALLRAAEEQATRRRRRRRRAIVVPALAAPLALAAAGSMAATGVFSGVDRHLSALRDDRLRESSGTAAKLESAAGERPLEHTRRTWRVGGRAVVGYTTAAGAFCFEFTGLTGGCLPRTGLSAADPVDVMTDNGPGMLRVYGLAMDGVTAVGLRAGGVTRAAAIGRNAFFLEAPALGSARGFTATLIVRLRDGTVRRIPLRIGGTAVPGVHLPRLPGMMPAANAAA
jgi:hypothetical protein